MALDLTSILQQQQQIRKCEIALQCRTSCGSLCELVEVRRGCSRCQCPWTMGRFLHYLTTMLLHISILYAYSSL